MGKKRRERRRKERGKADRVNSIDRWVANRQSMYNPATHGLPFRQAEVSEMIDEINESLAKGLGGPGGED